MSGISDTDHGWAELKKQMCGRTITIKVWSQARSRSASKSRYPSMVEQGTPKMAARPFMAETMARHDQYIPQAKQAIDCVLDGTDTLDEMMEVLGEVMVDDMRNMIEEMGLVRTSHMHDTVVKDVKL
jgi:hypothetical protein